MSLHTTIEWCDSTANPVPGCDGCELWIPEHEIRRCYAGVMTERYGGKTKGYPKLFLVPEMFPGRMAAAAKWRDLTGTARADKPWLDGLPRLVFISDMGDALSKSIPFEYLKAEIIDVASSWKHLGLWLTKQPGRMVLFSRWLAQRGIAWPANLWAMSSVTGPKTLWRAERLGEVVGPVVRGLSIEPMDEEVDLKTLKTQHPIDWAILGFESGARVRAGDLDGMRRVLGDCRALGIVPFIKQLGTAWARANRINRYDDSKGGDWSRWPADLRVREMPRPVAP